MQVARSRSLFDGYGQSDGRGLEELGNVEFVDLHGHRCRFALERAFGVNRRTVNLERKLGVDGSLARRGQRRQDGKREINVGDLDVGAILGIRQSYAAVGDAYVGK